MERPEHDLIYYHGKYECRRCTRDWCCMLAASHDPICSADAPILPPTIYEEVTGMRVAFTDGEMTGLNADGWDQLLCAGIAEFRPPKFDSHGKCILTPWTNVRVIQFEREHYDTKRWDDLPIAEAWEAALDEYDLIVTWNGIKFDEPFLRTRKAEYGLTTKPWRRHKDLMYTARYKLKMSSASLKNVCNHLGIFERYGIAKTETTQGRWRKAICGHWPSYQYIVKHCEHDVKVLAAVWQELIPWVTEIK